MHGSSKSPFGSRPTTTIGVDRLRRNPVTGSPRTGSNTTTSSSGSRNQTSVWGVGGPDHERVVLEQHLVGGGVDDSREVVDVGQGKRDPFAVREGQRDHAGKRSGQA